MCIVDEHEKFDASIQQTEMTVPSAREYTNGLKWRLEHGEERGEYDPATGCYVITYEEVQVYYSVTDKPGEPRRITLLTTRPRPEP